MSNGRLVQTGGWADGYHRVRIYKSCGTCDWKEIPNGLNQQRWYETNHLLPDGRQIIIGGRQAFNYEFYSKMLAPEISPSFPFLVQTNDPRRMILMMRIIYTHLYFFIRTGICSFLPITVLFYSTTLRTKLSKFTRQLGVFKIGLSGFRISENRISENFG
ncbi:putative glyoxal oxidase, galactose oxidase/kelch, beta-propeller [Helianthus anomalus]